MPHSPQYVIFLCFTQCVASDGSTNQNVTVICGSDIFFRFENRLGDYSSTLGTGMAHPPDSREGPLFTAGTCIRSFPTTISRQAAAKDTNMEELDVAPRTATQHAS